MRLATKATEAENLFAILAQDSPVGICIIQDGEFCYTNPTFQHNTGYREDELLGRDSLELIVPEDREMARENAIKMLKGEITSPHEFRVMHKDGSIHWVVESVASVKYCGRRAILGNLVDITEHKQVEETVQHLNLVLRAIRDINQLIAKRTDRDNLLKGACDTFVKTRGYYSAWIALLDESGKLVTAAEAGLGKSFLQVMESLKRGELTPCGCKVLEKPGVLVMKDVSSECEDCPLAKEDTGRGAMSVRLEYGGKVYGLMTVSIPPGRAAEREEHDLFEEIAGDIAFALYNIEQEQERKRADKELSKTQAQLSNAVQMAHLGPWEYDAINDLFIFNDAFYDMFHTTAEEVGGYTMSSAEYARRFVHPEDTHLVGEEVRKALQADDPNFSRQLDHRIIYADGEVGYISVRFFIVKDETGSTVRTYGVNQDITERKQAEETLQAERNKLQSLVDAMEDTITIQDTEYNIIYQNEPSRIASDGDHLGEKCYRVYEGRESICEDCPLEKAFKDGKSHASERRTVISGKVAFWENTANPIRDAAGKIVSCLELARDITERKQAEEALQMGKNKLQSIIDAMQDELTIQDTEYNIIFQNEPAKINSGGDHVGEKCYRVYNRRESICEDCPLEKAFKDGKPHTTERQQVLPSGEISFLENTANPIRDAEGGIVACLEIGRDVTERKEHEQALADELTRRRLLIDQSVDGIVVIDENDKV
ncbi:MAG: PAS domain S-box protein, partial [Desulfatiglandales bacterium]